MSLGVTPFGAPKKMTQRVSDMLRHKIITGDLKEGDFIPPEAALLGELGVSRPTLREALRVLEAEGLIVTRRGARTGAEVRSPSLETAARSLGHLFQFQNVTLADMHKAREFVEPPLARALSERKTPEILAAVEEALRVEAEVVDDPIAFSHASVRFHERVAELAGVFALYAVVRQFNWILELHHDNVMRDRVESGAHAMAATNSRRSHRSHVKFVEILRDGSADEVEKYWRGHIQQIGAILLADGKQATCLELSVEEDSG